MADILLITGLSGAGRTQAANDLEDLGWFVVDNLPIALLDKVVELGGNAGAGSSRLGLVVGPTEDQQLVLSELQRLRNREHRVRVLFLEASTPELVKRYGHSRRKHPLDDGASGIAETIERERALLQPVKQVSDVVVDTTSLTVHQLKARVRDLVGGDDAAMRISVMSFGYKHGLPTDVDLVMDVRFLPNPHWIDELRPLTGIDEPVRRYVLGQPGTSEFLARFEHLLELLVPAYASEGKSYLSIAVGCTGGQHRSVVIAEQLAAWLRRQGHAARVTHRDAHHGA